MAVTLKESLTPATIDDIHGKGIIVKCDTCGEYLFSLLAVVEHFTAWDEMRPNLFGC